jgi:hypothetical protein
LPTSGSTHYFAVGTSGAFVVPAPTITASGGVVASSPGSGTSGYVGNTITINFSFYDASNNKLLNKKTIVVDQNYINTKLHLNGHLEKVI